MGSPYYDQVHRHQASTPSKLGGTSSNKNNNITTSNSTSNSTSRSIATNTAKVLNKINTLVRPQEPSPLKSRPCPKRPPPVDRFQMVHTPDRAPGGGVPMWDIPRTETEYRAALKRIRMQNRDQDQDQEAGTGGGVGVGGGSYGRIPSSSSLRSVPSMHSLGVEGAAFERPRRGGLTTSSSTPMVLSTPGLARMPPRVLSVEALRAPRPLSERALIPLGQRGSSRNEYIPGRVTNTASGLVVSPVVTPRSSSGGDVAEGVVDGRTAVNPGTKAMPRRIRRMRSFDSISTTNTGNIRPGTPSARQTGGVSEARDTGGTTARTPGMTECYVCQEPCKSGAGLCAGCKSRFQPMGEVFEDSDSDSEYGDENENEELPDTTYSPPRHSPPAVPATAPAPRPEHLGDGMSLRAGAGGGRSSSPSSSPRRSGDLASRSASESPTPQLAHNMQLKVVPYPMIRKVSVGSPARERGEEGSALYLVQQAMKPREPMTPGAGPGPGRDGIRVGRVHSGEGALVDGCEGGAGGRAGDARRGSRGSYGEWLRYYERTREDDDDEDGGYVPVPCEVVSPITNCDLFSGKRNGESARSSTYDLIYSIYNEYCDQQDDEDHGGMI